MSSQILRWARHRQPQTCGMWQWVWKKLVLTKLGRISNSTQTIQKNLEFELELDFQFDQIQAKNSNSTNQTRI